MSENGVDDPGEAALGLPGALRDDFRTSFFRGYVRAAEDAVTQDQARCLFRCLLGVPSAHRTSFSGFMCALRRSRWSRIRCAAYLCAL